MTDTTRQEALQVLADLGNLYPAMRFGQLMNFVCTLAGTTEPSNIYDLEDEDLIAAVRKHILKRTQALAS